MNTSKAEWGVHHRLRLRFAIGATFILTLLLLAACGREQPPTDANGSSKDSVTSASAGTVPAAPEVQPTVAITSAEMQIPVVTLEPTPEQGLLSTPVSTAAGVITGTDEITAAPLVVNEGADCQIESDLDLAGYDGVEEMMGCPLEAATFDPIGLNEFGQGPDYSRFMLWFGGEGQIYVLFPDNVWRTYPDTWVEGRDPEITCNPLGGELTSPPLPRRGFGKLWCEDVQVQDVMGTVEREERLCQHTVVQRFEKGRVVACFEDATVRYFRIMDDNAWHLDMQR